jgi:hypothetical protein
VRSAIQQMALEHRRRYSLGIPRCGMHAFRHTQASLLISSGASPVVAQRQLRHSDVRTTLENYVHVLGDEHRRAAERVADQLRPVVTKVTKMEKQPNGFSRKPGRGGGDRTHDLRLKRPLLYH